MDPPPERGRRLAEIEMLITAFDERLEKFLKRLDPKQDDALIKHISGEKERVLARREEALEKCHKELEKIDATRDTITPRLFDGQETNALIHCQSMVNICHASLEFLMQEWQARRWPQQDEEERET